MVSAVRDPFLPVARFELRFASSRRSLFSSTVLGSVLWGALLLTLALLLPLWHPAPLEERRPRIDLQRTPMLPPPPSIAPRLPAHGAPPKADRGRILPRPGDMPLPPAAPDYVWDVGESKSSVPPGPDVGPVEAHDVVPPLAHPIDEPVDYYDEPPLATHRPEPQYPDIARSGGIEGVVRLEVVVDRDGAVRSARVLEPGSLFDDAALKAARQWRFRPATVNGHPVTAKVGLTFRFTLH
jgi:protein TonB